MQKSHGRARQVLKLEPGNEAARRELEKLEASVGRCLAGACKRVVFPWLPFVDLGNSPDF